MLPEGCPIPNASGCIEAEGPVDAPLVLVGEAGGKIEAIKGRPFVGPAGDQLTRLLSMVGISRESVRITNCIRCSPPRDWLVGAPWEDAAIRHCQPHLDAILSEPHKVIIPLGGTALRTVLKLPRSRSKDGVKVQDFHGAPVRMGERWVVPTFHPSHLLQGAQKLTKVVCYDLQLALDIAAGKLDPSASEPDLVIDPPIDWFAAWAAALPDDAWLSPDVETSEKTDAESESEFGDAPIVRINFAYSTDQGVTVPWSEPYLPTIRRLLASPCQKWYWNSPYDLRKLRQHGITPAGENHCAMSAWHVLQSSLPQGLGFVAPLYSMHGPWKHLGSKSGRYCALDPVAALRCAFGITRDLEASGLWPVYRRRMYELNTICFRPAEAVGLRFDRPALKAFDAELAAVIEKTDAQCQAIVPESCKPLSAALKRKPEGGESNVFESIEECFVQCCDACGAVQVSKSHRCADKSLVPAVVLQPRQVPRYYRRLPFNPASWQQVLAYILFRKHKPGRAKKTHKDTTDKKTLRRLLKTGDPLYPLLLTHRSASKMRGTYSQGILARLDPEDRVHCTFTDTPSTLRKSCAEPNLQNMASHVDFAAGFRRCVVAAPGCLLASADYSGIEAVIVGYLMGDPEYIKLAKCGIHAYVSSHHLYIDKLIPEPANPKWPESDLREMFAELKKRFPVYYNADKRGVHGVNYLLTEYGLSDAYPEMFPKRSDARKLIDIYTAVCPNLRPWQRRVVKAAHEKKFLGGFPSGRAVAHDARYAELITEFAHPFGYRHWFWNALQYKKVQGRWEASFGEDAKRSVAFMPQSIAMGVDQEALLRLFDPASPNYIGDVYFGKTPLRAMIHDDNTVEFPAPRREEVLAKLVSEMTRPVLQLPMPAAWNLGEYLSIGVEVKVGKNWAPRTESNPDGMAPVSGVEDLAADRVIEEEDEDALPDTAIVVA